MDDSDDPLIKELSDAIRRAKKKGRLKVAPRRSKDVRTFEELCLFVFRHVGLDGTHQLEKDGGKVLTWVWCGSAFNDKIVRKVEDLLPQLEDQMRSGGELRLVSTRVSEEGLARLIRCFPSIRVTRYISDDSPDWELAYYHGQADSKWRETMIRDTTSYLDA